MREITIDDINKVEGGFLALIGALVAVFTLPKIINDHRVEYNNWGHAIGQTTFDNMHPYDPNNPQGIYK